MSVWYEQITTAKDDFETVKWIDLWDHTARSRSPAPKHLVEVGIAVDGRMDVIGTWDQAKTSLTAGKKVRIYAPSDQPIRLRKGQQISARITSTGSPSSIEGVGVEVFLGRSGTRTGLVTPSIYADDRGDGLASTATQILRAEVDGRFATVSLKDKSSDVNKVPEGGAAGLFLKKTSATNYDTEWAIPTAPIFHARDEKAANTHGGTFTSGAWRTRVLNTEVTNEITGASLASNQVTLTAGTYYIEAMAPTQAATLYTKAKWYNTTDTADEVVGTNGYMGANHYGTCFVAGRFTITATKVFELQHRCSGTVATWGLGFAGNFTSTEVYADVRIWQIA